MHMNEGADSCMGEPGMSSAAGGADDLSLPSGGEGAGTRSDAAFEAAGTPSESALTHIGESVAEAFECTHRRDLPCSAHERHERHELTREIPILNAIPVDLTEGALVVIAGRFGSGTTALAVNSIAVPFAVATGSPVVIFSPDTDRIALASQMMVAESRVSRFHLLQGMLSIVD